MSYLIHKAQGPNYCVASSFAHRWSLKQLHSNIKPTTVCVRHCRFRAVPGMAVGDTRTMNWPYLQCHRKGNLGYHYEKPIRAIASPHLREHVTVGAGP